MNRTAVATAPLAALAAGVGFMALLAAASPVTPEENRAGYYMGVAIMSVPWAVAAGLIWYAAWRAGSVRLKGLDTPARLLAIAVATLPAERHEWGEAMTAELDQVTDRRSRWQFALGCVRTALFPPRGHRVPVLVVAAIAAALVTASGFLAGSALRTFAVAFAAVVGAGAIGVAARSRKLHRPAQTSLVLAVGLAAVIACVVIAAYLRGKATVDPILDVLLGVLLAACLWLIVAPPRSLTSSRIAQYAGLATALLLAAGLLTAIVANERSGEGVGFVLLLPQAAVYFLAAAVTAAFARSFSAGLQALVWSVVLSSLVTFAVFIVAAQIWYREHGTLLLDAASGPLGQNLGDAVIWILISAPLWAFPFGIIGAALGSVRSHLHQPLTAPVTSR